MRFHLLFCASLTLVCQGFPLDVASQQNKEASHWAGKGIQNPLHRLHFHQEDMLKLRDRARDIWKNVFKAALMNRRVPCDETNPEGPCQRKRRWSSRGRSFYRASNGDRSAPGPCDAGQFAGADKKKIACSPESGKNKKRGVRRQAFASIAVAPGRRRSKPAVEPCPPGSFRNRLGQCWNTMSS